jgi:hypothetical protein
MKPSLILRPSGIYYIRIREHGIDRYVSTQSRDKKTAEDFLTRFLTKPEPEVTLSGLRRRKSGSWRGKSAQRRERTVFTVSED